uniref:CX domain-containing protein n=1 Tax=Globodera pallida TaxID=36090 RepID=A0A183BVL4_GLOPA
MIQCKLRKNMFLDHNPTRRIAYQKEESLGMPNYGMIYWMCRKDQRCSAKEGCIYYNHREFVEEHGGLSAGVIVAIAFGSLALLIICGVIAVLIIYKFFPSVFGRMAAKRGNSKSSIASTHRTTMMNQAYSAISTYFRTRRTAKTKKVSVLAKPSAPTKYRSPSGHPSSGATKQPTNFGPGSSGSKPNKTKYPSSATPKHQSKYPPSDGSYTQFQRKH